MTLCGGPRLPRAPYHLNKYAGYTEDGQREHAYKMMSRTGEDQYSIL